MCTDVAVTAFNPNLFAKAVLYESIDLHAQALGGSTHTMANVTVDGVAALTAADALLTLVLAPGDAPGAMAYFAQNAGEGVRLDEVYMSHAKPAVSFGTVRNALASAPAADGSARLSVVVDSALLARCPLESAAGFSYASGAFDSVTTHDYGAAGALRRPRSGVDTHFVYELRGGSEDLEWLRSNIFGASFAGHQAAEGFLARVCALVPEARRAHARSLWLWPLYAWPTKAPVGLKDKTLLSLAWSIGAREADAGAGPDGGSRCLLARPAADAAPAPLPVLLPAAPRKNATSRVRLFDLYRRRIDVQALRRESNALRHAAYVLRSLPTRPTHAAHLQRRPVRKRAACVQARIQRAGNESDTAGLARNSLRAI